MSRQIQPPFQASLELDHSLTSWHPKHAQANLCLPGQPRVSLSDADSVLDFLESDLLTIDLDNLEPYLWLISTPLPSNITPLHRQCLRGRRITPMEDPDLHLVWHRYKIFVKPLPAYLCSYAFWEHFVHSPQPQCADQKHAVAQAALGLLRSYSHLVKHPSDFAIAQRDDLQLISKKVTYEDFCRFIAAFEHLNQDDVSKRYRRYGELRFSRLNYLFKIVLWRWSFRDTSSDYRDYFERFFGPLLFVFAVLSVLLNAMQVVLAAEGLDDRYWRTFWSMSRWFAVSTIAVALLLTGVMLLLLARKMAGEILYAVRKRLGRMFR
ncbi:hypothetical protein LTR85_000893 [Meristemomyces frigidus]|nr:hypothetical protein LTR85_000893 [Meristemomyces frigidus]